MIIPTYGIYMISLISLLIVVVFVIVGYQRGAILKVLDFVSTFLCLPIAWIISSLISKLAPDLFEIITIQDSTFINEVVNQTLNKIIIFIIVFIILRVLCFLLTPFCKFIDKIPVIGSMDKILGSIVGCIQGLLIVLLFSYILCTPAFLNGREVRIKSGLEYLRTTVESVVGEPKTIKKEIEIQDLINNSNLGNLDIENMIEKIKSE